jgi:broad specificity phosphatase PhoE
MKLFLLRHGQSQNNAGLTDNLDSDLTPLGEEQAQRTGEHLKTLGIGRIYVSPLRRTLQTIAPYCLSASARAHLYPQVCEYFSANYPAYKEFPGLAPAEIRKQYPFVDIDPVNGCDDVWWPQEFENDDIVYARAVKVRDSLQAEYGNTDEHLLIVSHSDVVGRLIEAFLRIPPVPDDPPWADNCSLTLLESGAAEVPANLVYQNSTDHLKGATSNAS